MHQTACLPPSFWQDAVEIALHVYNCQPMHHLDWLPPISKWNGKTPDVSYCYGPTHWDYISMDLVNFSLFFILSDNFRLQTVRRLPTGTHLSHTLHHSTNMCLHHGEPCFIKSNFILDSSFLCCAWLCCHTHAYFSCSCFPSILPSPCGCIMLLISIMLALDSISRSDTNMYCTYSMPVYKGQGIDWQLQSDSLGVSSSKVNLFNSHTC